MSAETDIPMLEFSNERRIDSPVPSLPPITEGTGGQTVEDLPPAPDEEAHMDLDSLLEEPLNPNEDADHATPLASTPQAKENHANLQRGLWGNWKFEILSMLLSISCVVAMCIIFLTLVQKPLSAWNLPIKLNALVSVLSAIARAGLLYPMAECVSQIKWLHFRRASHRISELQDFDQASRGPWGSLLFLGSFKYRDWLASMTCIVVLFSLAFDPFSQQIISFPSRGAVSKHQGDEALTHASRGYDSGLAVMAALVTGTCP